MSSIKIVNQALNNKRTVFDGHNKTHRTVLFVFWAFFVIPMCISLITGEINKNNYFSINTLLFNEIFDENEKEVSMNNDNYTVIFSTSYGELRLDLETALTCILPITISEDYEADAIRAQAVLIRTRLISYADENNFIYIEKEPYTKKYFTFLEQKNMWQDNYEKNASIYIRAVKESKGVTFFTNIVTQ